MSNPIQQAIEAIEQARTELEQYEEDATGEHYNSPRLNAALSALHSLQGVKLPPLPEPDFRDEWTDQKLDWWSADMMRAYARTALLAAAPTPEATQPTQAEAPSEREAFKEAEAQIRHLVEDLTDLRVNQGVASYVARNGLLFSNCIAVMDRLLPRLRAALATQQAEQGEAVGIYQILMADGSWIDQSKHSYEYNLRNGAKGLRVLYTATPPAPQQPEARKCHYNGGTCTRRGCAIECQGSALALQVAQQPEALAQQERDREDAELLRRALYYLEADAAGRYGVQGLEEMVRAGDHPVVADLRKRLGGSARFPGAARSSEGGSPSPSMVGREDTPHE